MAGDRTVTDHSASQPVDSSTTAMVRFLRFTTLAFAVLYAAAISLFVVGTLGLFGAERDPLAGVFLLPLGLPWNRMFDAAPEPLWPWLVTAAPLLNLFFLWCVYRAVRPRREP